MSTDTTIVDAPVPITVPVPNVVEYTPSQELWFTLRDEINAVATRIDAGEELEPTDVDQVRQLKKQVDAYLTSFNKAMRDAQADYKSILARELDHLGYTKIETYIQQRRNVQTMEQNQRLQDKQSALQALIIAGVANTIHVKATVISQALLPAFTQRFPIVCSGAKTKEIANWGPYEAVISTTLQMLDTFFADPLFVGAMTLPITSATMRSLLAYVRSGDLSNLTGMRNVFAQDKAYLDYQKLTQQITSKEVALAQITQIMEQTTTTDEKITAIGQIIRLAETL